jgi:hypothetical protein
MEKLSKSLVTIGGVLYLIFGIFHLTFFKIFSSSNPGFNQIIPSLSKIMIMLNVGMVVFFFSMGAVMLRFRSDIIGSKLGKALLIMSAIFFIVRGTAEFVFPSFKIAFVITMFVVSTVYFIPVFFSRNKM